MTPAEELVAALLRCGRELHAMSTTIERLAAAHGVVGGGQVVDRTATLSADRGIGGTGTPSRAKALRPTQRTPAREAKLRELWARVPRVPDKECLAELNALPGPTFKPTSLSVWATELGLPRRVPPSKAMRSPERDALLRDLWAVKPPLRGRVLAERLNALPGGKVTTNGIFVIADALDLPRRRQPRVRAPKTPRRIAQRTPERALLLRRLWAQRDPKLSYWQILEQLNRLDGAEFKLRSLATWAAFLGLPARRDAAKAERGSPQVPAVDQPQAIDIASVPETVAAAAPPPSEDSSDPVASAVVEPLPPPAPPPLAPMRFALPVGRHRGLSVAAHIEAGDAQAEIACPMSWPAILEWANNNRVPTGGDGRAVLTAVNNLRRAEGLPPFTPIKARGPETRMPHLAVGKDGLAVAVPPPT